MTISSPHLKPKTISILLVSHTYNESLRKSNTAGFINFHSSQIPGMWHLRFTSSFCYQNYGDLRTRCQKVSHKMVPNFFSYTSAGFIVDILTVFIRSYDFELLHRRNVSLRDLLLHATYQSNQFQLSPESRRLIYVRHRHTSLLAPLFLHR